MNESQALSTLRVLSLDEVCQLFFEQQEYRGFRIIGMEAEGEILTRVELLHVASLRRYTLTRDALKEVKQ